MRNVLSPLREFMNNGNQTTKNASNGHRTEREEGIAELTKDQYFAVVMDYVTAAILGVCMARLFNSNSPPGTDGFVGALVGMAVFLGLLSTYKCRRLQRQMRSVIAYICATEVPQTSPEMKERNNVKPESREV